MRILIGGDVIPTDVNRELFEKGDVVSLFGRTAELAKKADRVLINFEGVLTDGDTPIRKIGPNLKGSTACVNALKAFGVTDVMLANNHSVDYGVSGLRDTLRTLGAAGIRYAGVGENDTDSRKAHILEKNGERIGVINACEHEYTYALPDRPGANPFDPFLTMQDIRELKKKVDHVIFIYHGAKEFSRYPSPRVYRLAREAALCGADVVLTQHSHCLGCCEKFGDAYIVHGQGNFVFCEPGKTDSWNTGVLTEIDTDGGLKVTFRPFRMNERGVDLAEGNDLSEIESGFEARSEELADGRWLDGWHAFCEQMREKYTNVLRNLKDMDENERALQMFAHFLDCEAHEDVWHEIFPTWHRE